MMQLQSLRRSFSRSLASNGHNGKETDKKVARAPKALSFFATFSCNGETKNTNIFKTNIMHKMFWSLNLFIHC